MVVDANAYLGRWGVRTRGIASPRDFLALMDRHGIGVSVVTDTVALVTDTREGNRRLPGLVAPYRDRLVPAACVNPIWGLDEAKECFSGGAFRIARLFPGMHNYSLLDAELLDPFMEFFADNDIPILVTVDLNYGFAGRANKIGFSPPRYPMEEVVAFAEKRPGHRILACGYAADVTHHMERIVCRGLELRPNLHLDISNMYRAGDVVLLSQRFPEQILLGTLSALNDPGAAIGKVSLSTLDDDAKERVLWRNARAFFAPAI